MLRTQKNSKKQGDVGVGIAIGWFVQHGYTVCLPLTDSQDYDIVVEIDGVLKKVQVKTTYCLTPEGNYVVTLKVSGGNKTCSTTKHFDKSFADYLFVVTEKNVKYFIPSADIENRATMNLGRSKEKYIVG